jgi:magnesium transporter
MPVFALHGHERIFLLTADNEPTTTQSFIGIIVAICGNVVISLALNCQKLAHQRIERKRENSEPEYKRESSPIKPANGEASVAVVDAVVVPAETEPLLNGSDGTRYGSSGPKSPMGLALNIKAKPTPPKVTHRSTVGSEPQSPLRLSSLSEDTVVPIQPTDIPISPNEEDILSEPDESRAPVSHLHNEEAGGREEEDISGETEYLKTKLW